MPGIMQLVIAEPVRPTVDSEVARFHAWRRGDLSGRRLERVDGAGAALRRCFTLHADAVLTDAERGLLVLERAFGEDGAAARVADPDALLLVIPRFLLDPTWHGDRIDRGVRHLFAWQLAHHVERLREVADLDLEPAMEAVRAAELHARRCIRRERSDALVREAEERGGPAEREGVRGLLAGVPPRPEPAAPELVPLGRPFRLRRG